MRRVAKAIVGGETIHKLPKHIPRLDQHGLQLPTTPNSVKLSAHRAPLLPCDGPEGSPSPVGSPAILNNMRSIYANVG